MKRVLVVPWSRAPTYFVMCVSRYTVDPICRASARHQTSAADRRRRCVDVAPGSWWPARPLAQVARPPLAGDERHRGEHALLRRRAAVRPGHRPTDAPSAIAAAQRVAGGDEGVDHRLVAGLGLARSGGPRRCRPRRPWRTPRASRASLPSDGASHLHEEHPVERAAGAPDRRDEGRADGLEGRPDVGGGEAVQLADHGREAAVHVDPVIGIADRRVQLREVRLVLRHDGGEPADPGKDVVVRDHRRLRARAAGVWRW